MYEQYRVTGKESHQCLYARSKYHLKAGGSIEEYLLGLTSGSSRSHGNHKGGRPKVDYSKWVVTGKESRNCLAQRKYNEAFEGKEYYSKKTEYDKKYFERCKKLIQGVQNGKNNRNE